MPKNGDLRLATPEILPQVSTNGKFYLIIRNCFWRVFILTGVLILGMQFWSLYSNLQRNSDYLVSTRPIIVTCNYTDCWGHPLADSFVRALTSEAGLPECPANAPNLLGSLEVLLGNVSSSDLENIRRALDSDATWKPPFCQPSRKTAVIIPFRDRAAHLSILLNAGYLEAMAKSYDCFIFHDVDLLPEDDRVYYRCGKNPRHLSVSVDKFNYTLPYKQLIGGAAAFTHDQYSKVNGYSNSYWGWGGEDDDLAKRISYSRQQILRPPADLARYKMLRHVHDAKNPENPLSSVLLSKTWRRFRRDGLSNVQYEVKGVENRGLYKWLLIDVGTKPDDETLIEF